MWEPDEDLEDFDGGYEDDEEPLGLRRRRGARLLALVLVAALVLALIIPVVVRVFGPSPADPGPEDPIQVIAASARLAPGTVSTPPVGALRLGPQVPGEAAADLVLET